MRWDRQNRLIPNELTAAMMEGVMANQFNRRKFLKRSVATSAAGAAMAMSFEEQVLMASAGKSTQGQVASGADPVPSGRIGKAEISRLICGGNLISGYAHSRDLIYVSPLLTHYFTDEKILETWAICEAHGINTMICYSEDQRAVELYRKYCARSGARMQFLAQIKPTATDLKTVVDRAVDHGACGAFLLGNIGDLWIRENRLDLIEKLIGYIQSKGVIAGVAGHALETVIAVDSAQIGLDFYMKTLHSTDYWSSRRPDQNRAVIDNYAVDNYWEMTPVETIEFMREVKTPWIAYKVLAAGAIHPREGFDYAFGNGADFACVGMFDFQIGENAAIANRVLAAHTKGRERPWMA